MQREVFHPVVIVSCVALVCLAMGMAAESAKAEETEILNITIGEPTLLNPFLYQNTASVSVSRTGVVAAFYPTPAKRPRFYRTSTDGGETLGPQMDSP